MGGERVLVVVPDDAAGQDRRHLFEQAGYRVTALHGDARDAMNEVVHSWPDLIVLSECSARHGAFELFSYLWGNWPIPVIVVGQREDVDSSVRYYEMGADAYLNPSVGSRELLARTRNLLRMAHETQHELC